MRVGLDEARTDASNQRNLMIKTTEYILLVSSLPIGVSFFVDPVFGSCARFPTVGISNTIGLRLNDIDTEVVFPFQLFKRQAQAGIQVFRIGVARCCGIAELALAPQTPSVSVDSSAACSNNGIRHKIGKSRFDKINLISFAIMDVMLRAARTCL